MTESRDELIDIVGRILASGDWDNPDIDNCDIGPKSEVRGYAAEIVTALRPEAKEDDREHLRCPIDPCRCH